MDSLIGLVNVGACVKHSGLCQLGEGGGGGCKVGTLHQEAKFFRANEISLVSRGCQQAP